MTKLTSTIPKPLKGTIRKRRQTAQAILRGMMEEAAPDIIKLFKNAVLLGEIDGKEISNKARVDLMKAYMPFVLPQLKSIEITGTEARDMKPLIINTYGSGDVHIHDSTDEDAAIEKTIDGQYEEQSDISEDISDAINEYVSDASNEDTSDDTVINDTPIAGDSTDDKDNYISTNELVDTLNTLDGITAIDSTDKGTEDIKSDRPKRQYLAFDAEVF